MAKRETALRTARLVKARMILTDTSPADLADILRVSQSAISRRLTGETEFSVTQLAAIAPKLGVPVSELIPAAEPSVA